MIKTPIELPSRLTEAVSEARAKVRLGYPWWLRPFLMRDVVAITLGRRIYLRGQEASASIERTILHELAHVRQVNRLGLPRFLWRYSAEFIRLWRRHRTVAAAYSRISFEIEARAAEEPVGEPAYNPRDAE